MDERLRRRIVINPEIMVGKPVIKGTRIPVDAILMRFADGMTEDDIIHEFPRITKEDIRAALEYGASVVRGEDITPFQLKPRLKHEERTAKSN